MLNIKTNSIKSLFSFFLVDKIPPEMKQLQIFIQNVTDSQHNKNSLTRFENPGRINQYSNGFTNSINIVPMNENEFDIHFMFNFARFLNNGGISSGYLLMNNEKEKKPCTIQIHLISGYFIMNR